MSWYLPGGIPEITKVPSSRVTDPLEVLFRKTLTPGTGLPVAESLTDPDKVAFGDWARRCVTVSRRRRLITIFLMIPGFYSKPNRPLLRSRRVSILWADGISRDTLWRLPP